MNDNHSEIGPTSIKLTFTCAICGVTIENLPNRGESQLVKMQQHAIDEHGITKLQIICARRESPRAHCYQWRLLDGRVYLTSNRIVEEKTDLECIHHWIIDNGNVGICKYCNQKRDFGRLLGQHVKITTHTTKNPLKKDNGATKKRNLKK
jgi:hypothetical protein